MITAPYSFVPLNKEVFYPSWDKKVSHDIPFSDGESGVFEIKVSAETAIYIRNHYTPSDNFYLDNKGNKISTEFCYSKDENGGKQYYIPSSSIKGMIRNIMEIMSFSKMSVDEKELSKPLSVRDMTQDKKTGKVFNHDMVATAKKCGFLIKTGDKYFIEKCGDVLTVRDSEIRRKIHAYSRGIDTAEEKYNTFGHIDFPFDRVVQTDGNGRKTTVAVYNNSSIDTAQLIMTGFIDNKKNEFLFKTNGIEEELKQKIFENFEKVYFLNEEAIDGQYWKKEWRNGNGRKIPIFYIEKDKKISAIGLTQIFKLSYKKTLFDAINQRVDKSRLDLSETIFGTVRGESALKGRVHFSHMPSTHVTYEAEKSEILGSPQPTYYPNYLRQTNTAGEEVNRYMTLMDNEVEISGYKRYPLHNGIRTSFIPNEEQTDIQTKFKPLNRETVFKGKVRFHNLKKVEIGALISALTFHGNSDCRHNIGMAKSLGFGKVKIDITLNGLQYEQNEYLKEYEQEMTLFTANWIDSTQLTELFSISSNRIISDRSLEYQKLENPNTRDREKNDFTKAKKSKEYLRNYSDIGNVEQVDIQSFVNNEELEEERIERVRLKGVADRLEEELNAQRLLDEQREREEKVLLEKELSKWDAIHTKNNEKYLKKGLLEFIEKYPNSSRIEKAKKELETLNSSKVKVTNQSLDFSKSKDVKSIEKPMKPIQNPTDTDRNLLEDTIKRVYPTLNARKKKQLLNSKLIVRWLGQDRLDKCREFLQNNL